VWLALPFAASADWTGDYFVAWFAAARFASLAGRLVSSFAPIGLYNAPNEPRCDDLSISAPCKVRDHEGWCS
jgi:hypothetical protein